MKKAIILKTIVAVMLMSASWSPAATLIHRYEFNSDLTDSVGSVNGTATGNATYTEAPTYVTAAPSGATGLTQSLYVGQNVGTLKSGFTLANTAVNLSEGSLSLWIDPAQASAGTGDDYVLHLANVWTTSSAGLAIYIPASTLTLGAVVTNKNLGGGTLTQNSWSHIVMTWDGDGGGTTGVWSLYVNGVLKGSTSYNLDGLTTTSALNFGGYSLSNSSSSLTSQYSGYIYDVQSYSGVLDATEVSYLYNNPGLTAVPEPGSVALLGWGGGVLAWAWIRKKRNFVKEQDCL